MKALLTILFFLSSHFSFAGDEFPTPEIIVTPMSQNETSLDTTSQQEPENITLDIQGIVSHDELSKVPKKSRYLKLLEKLLDRSPKKVKSILTKLKLSQEFQEVILKDLTDQLNQAPDTIMTANASGFGIRPVVFCGTGLSQYLINKFRDTKWGKYIPERASLGLALAGGGSILIFTKEGRKHILIRFSIQYETPTDIINWMGEGLAGAAPFKVSDKIDLSNDKIAYSQVLNYPKSYLGLAGTIVSHDGYFEHAFPLGLSAGVGFVSFYKLAVHERRFNVVISRQILVNLRNAAVNTCRRVLRIKPSTSE